MAFISHRCGCGHLLINHKGPGHCAQKGGAGCGNPCSKTLPPPEVVPTWDVQRRPITAIAEPGTSIGHGYPTMHDCDACRELYAQVT